MNKVVVQLIGLIAFFFSLIAYHYKRKDKILINMIVSSLFNLVHYFLLGAFSGCITKGIAIFRDLFIIVKDKYKLNSIIFLYIFVAIYIIAGILSYNSIYSILPIIAAIIYVINIWNGNAKVVKKSAFYCYFIWLLYNVCVMSIAGIISNTISIISSFIAIKNFKIE